MTNSDKRQSEREFPRRVTAQVSCRNTVREFQILDESSGGLGLFSPDDESLREGDAVAVTIAGCPPRDAVVCYVRAHAHGGYHIGLQWE